MGSVQLALPVLKIAYAFHRDAASVSVQSGRPASILRSFRRLGVELEEFFPLHSEFVHLSTPRKILHRLIGRHFRADRDEGYLRGFADDFKCRAQGREFDLVFSPGSEAITHLQTSRPITFCADATFANMVNYYWDFTNLSPGYLRKGHEQEKAALARASLAIYPSAWAAKSAMEDYGAAPEKVAVIPFGANLGEDNSLEKVDRWIEARATDKIRVLFVGKHWLRKGGDIAVETVRLLRRVGLSATLDVVGCDVPDKYSHETWIIRHGSLRANNASEAAQLSQLFVLANFVLVPSRAEAYGLTFCEANAFGVPAVASATGGISSIIIDGKNGLLLPEKADPAQFADAIQAAFANADSYRALCRRSYAEFKERLNWGTFCETFLKTVKERFPDLAAVSSVDRPKRIRAAYVTSQFLDPESANSWSGLPYHIKRSIESAGVDFVSISPKKEWGKLRRMVKFLGWKFLAGKRFLRYSDTTCLQHLAREVAAEIESNEVDLVFSPSTWAIAYLDTSLPIVFWTDATFAAVLGFYDSFDNLAPPSMRDGDAADRSALNRCTRAIYSSDWAAQSAHDHYGVSIEKLAVVPFGANLEPLPTTEDVETFLSNRPADFCEILLVGVEWKRKGVEIAIETIQALTKRNFGARLTIVGCEPPGGTTLPDNVELIPFLNKKTPDGRKRLNEIFSRSHFFLMPSRADCTPVVYSEANSFGLPCLTTNVGGIPTIVRDGINGRLFALSARGKDYADTICQLMANQEEYQSLARRSKNEAQSRLSWAVSGRKVAGIFREAIQERAGTIGGRESAPV